MFDDLGIEGFSKRQLNGIEYTQYTKDLPSSISKERKIDNFSVKIQGQAKTPPEIEPLPFNNNEFEAFVVYYNLDQFEIKCRKTGKSLDLVKITPDGWTQKAIDLTSPTYMPPEVHSALKAYQTVNPNRRECVVNKYLGPDKDNSDKVVQITLWNTLIARFCEEVGNPMSNESFKVMRDAILARRDEILSSLNNKDLSDPQEIATRPF